MAGLYISHTGGKGGRLRHIRSLRFDTCATAPETRLLLAISRSHLHAMSTDCPATSNMEVGEAAISQPVVWGPISCCTSLVALPLCLLPRPFCDISGNHRCFATFRAHHHPLCRLIICRWVWGPGIGRDQRQGLAGDCPPAFAFPSRRWSDSDHACKRYILGRNWQSRSIPENAISRQLTSLICTNYTILMIDNAQKATFAMEFG